MDEVPYWKKSMLNTAPMTSTPLPRSRVGHREVQGEEPWAIYVRIFIATLANFCTS